jgi:glycosyltransferase involved in cell wall biosynthesis
LLAGDGPLLEESKKLAYELGLETDILFIGFRKDMKNLYKGSDLYVNSSKHEALSFAMIEVLASGLPLIATDMGGNRDIVNDETKCGILVNYDDSKGLAEAINKLMDSRALQAELRSKALKAARDRFDLDKKVDETFSLYTKSCSMSKPAANERDLT